MSDVFISYARSTAKQAQAVVEALRGLGYTVWIDDDLPAHRIFSGVIEEQMTAAKAAVVIWSADAVRSEWVLSEANRAREERKLVQVITDKTRLPMPFDTIQCADLNGWTGDQDAPGWRKVVSSIAELVGGPAVAVSPPASAPPPLPSKPSIAVLPFANLSSDPEQDYFADGMMEEITGALSRFRSLFVIGSGSTLTFKGKAVSPQEAGRQLGVRYVLEGSVRRAAGRVRIAVKLVDAADGAQIWGDRFEDTLEDVFALQDKVALSVGGVIEPAITEAEAHRVSRRAPENMSCYDLYLMGYAAFQAFRKEENLRALGLFERAIALDPKYASALALAAECHSMLVLYGWSGEPDEHRRLGLALAERALALAGSDDWVLAVVGNVLSWFDANPDRSAGLIDRAIALNPGSAYNWLASASLHLTKGDDEDIVVDHGERAMRLDPLSPINRDARMMVGIARFQQGRFAEALSLLNEASSPHPTAHAYLVAVLGHLGQVDAAREAMARYRASSGVPIGEAAMPPGHRKLFLDGIALAEGKNPPSGAAGAGS